MLNLKHILKSKFSGALIALAFALPLSLAMAAPAYAIDERYTWKDNNQNVIVATGGNFGSNNLELTKKSEDAKSVVFGASTTYACKNLPVTGDISVAIYGPDYKKSNPTAGKLTGPDSSCGFDVPVVKFTATTPGDEPDPKACDQGSFSWMMCPMIDNASSAISNLARDALVPLLKVNRITPTTTPDLYKMWLTVRDVTSVLMILAFFIIVIATALGQDITLLQPYNLRKTLPKLAIAAILLQFSFIFSGLIVDVGNVLGGGVSHLIDAVIPATGGSPSYANLLSNMAGLITGLTVAGVAGKLLFLTSWTIALPILVSLLITLMIIFLTLAARFIIITILVVLSPLAFLAWVLPGTNKYYTLWWKTFFRMILMYPIVIGLLSLAGVVSQLLGSDPSGGAAGSIIAEISVKLLKPLVVIAAFAMVPMSIKWSGSVMGKVHGMISGQGAKAQKALKGSDMYKEGAELRRGKQASTMKALATNSTISSLTGSRNPLKKVAGVGFMSATALALGGAPSTSRGINKAYQKSFKATGKTLESFDTNSPEIWKKAIFAATGDREARAYIRANAPELLDHMHSTGVKAMAKNLGKQFGPEEAEAVIAKFGPQVGAGIIGAAAKDIFTSKPYLYFTGNEGGYTGFLGGMKPSRMLDLDPTFYTAATGKYDKTTGQWTRTTQSEMYTRAMMNGLSSATNAAIMSGWNEDSKAKRLANLRWAAFNSDILSSTDAGRAHLDAMADQVHMDNNTELFTSIYKEVLHRPMPASVDHQRAEVLTALRRPGWVQRPQPQLLTPGQTQHVRGGGRGRRRQP